MESFVGRFGLVCDFKSIKPWRVKVDNFIENETLIIPLLKIQEQIIKGAHFLNNFCAIPVWGTNSQPVIQAYLMY